MSLEAAIAAYAAIGYARVELFTSWTASAVDYRDDPMRYRRLADRFGMTPTSLHLPPIQPGSQESLDEAVAAARFADALGVPVVLYKAVDRATYVSAAPAFLDATDSLDVIPVIQNHAGRAISSLEDVVEVTERIDDQRMRSLLEVGHFHSVGVHWREAAEYLGERLALVHIKDQIGRQSVPFGAGEVDLAGLFDYLDDRGYGGTYVIEMEVNDSEHTLDYLADARAFVLEYFDDGS